MSSAAASSTKQKVLARLCAPPRKDAAHLPPRSVLEQVIYAVLREGLTADAANRAYARLLDHHFDLNEIRVSTAREAADSLPDVPGAFDKADRIIDILQEVFETTFGFELETVAKKGLKLAEKQLQRYRGTTPFVVAFVLQQALGGHSLPLDAQMLRCLQRLKLIEPNATLVEVQSMLEHQVPKAKGQAFFEQLSQITHEFCLDQPRCLACPLLEMCPTGQINKHKKPAKPALAAKPTATRKPVVAAKATRASAKPASNVKAKAHK